MEWALACLAAGSLFLVGCHSQYAPKKPSIQFTRLPPAGPGGPGTLDLIEGRVNDAQPGQQIVLYARSGIWWIQPFSTDSVTRIQPDSTFKNSTHLGSEYAALLVQPGYHPQARMTALPVEGNGVVAVASGTGKLTAPIVSKVLHFSGYDWSVRAAGSDRGGQPNAYDPANAWTDEKGYLHLRMAQREGQWTCAEVSLAHSLGYGSYRFVVEDSAHLSPSAVVGIFTVDDFRTDSTRDELDIELSRWGNVASQNAQYVVQPFYVPENLSRFSAPAGVLTHVIRWEPGSASFKTLRGSGAGAAVIASHVFNASVPVPAAETVHIDLYDFQHSSSSSQAPAEVVVEKFEYLP
jgi:hypothetical protein